MLTESKLIKVVIRAHLLIDIPTAKAREAMDKYHPSLVELNEMLSLRDDDFVEYFKKITKTKKQKDIFSG